MIKNRLIDIEKVIDNLPLFNDPLNGFRFQEENDFDGFSPFDLTDLKSFKRNMFEKDIYFNVYFDDVLNESELLYFIEKLIINISLNISSKVGVNKDLMNYIDTFLSSSKTHKDCVSLISKIYVHRFLYSDNNINKDPSIELINRRNIIVKTAMIKSFEIVE